VSTDQLSATFAALADPKRRAILDRLTRGPATVGELAAPFAISGPAVSKHLRVLERAGLISQGREAQWRPCSLEASPLREVADYASGFRRFWEAQHDRLDAYLEDLQAATAGQPTTTNPSPTRSPRAAPDRSRTTRGATP
jgi:DNA-binding transcriptional ArsR family regulator